MTTTRSSNLAAGLRTTALMAATGMGGGGEAWAQHQRSEREALTLETVKLAVELGIDINIANTDGRSDRLSTLRRIGCDQVR